MTYTNNARKILMYCLLIIEVVALVVIIAQFFVSPSVKAMLPIRSSTIAMYLSAIALNTKILSDKNNWPVLGLFGVSILLYTIQFFIE